MPSASHKSISDEITRLSDRWVDAQLRNDASLVESILADDFCYTSTAGQLITKADWLRDVKGAKIERLSRSDQKVQLLGDTAVLTGIVEFSSRSSTGEVKGRCRYAAVFAKVGGAWKVAYSHFTPII